MKIDLNQIEAMQTTELEALYGELSTQEFTVKTALSVVSLELETRIKTRKNTPIGVEETTTSGDTRLELFRTGHFETGSHFAPTVEDAPAPEGDTRLRIGPTTDYEAYYIAPTVEDAPAPEGCDCEFCTGLEANVEAFITYLEREDAPAPEGCDCVFCDEPERKTRSDKGTTRTGVRAIDRSSCCGAEGHRMNTESLDCISCRGVVD